jgi:hypothetical protein
VGAVEVNVRYDLYVLLGIPVCFNICDFRRKTSVPMLRVRRSYSEPNTAFFGVIPIEELGWRSANEVAETLVSSVRID